MSMVSLWEYKTLLQNKRQMLKSRTHSKRKLIKLLRYFRRLKWVNSRPNQVKV
jgi:hypothetical protein